MYTKRLLRYGLGILLVTLLAMLPAVFAPTDASAATTSLTIKKLASDGTTVLEQKTVTYQELRDGELSDGTPIPVMGGDGTTHYYHQGPVFIDHPDEETEQMLRWNPEEDTNVDTKDMGALKGTNVKDLCELVGGMKAGETIKIKAIDGFSKTFAYKNVYQYSDREGPMVVCWYKDGNYPDSGYSDGMRLVWFADTSTNPGGLHAFGNWDWHEAADPEYWYYYLGSGGEKYPTTTGLSVQYVSELTIYSNEDPPVMPEAVFAADVTSGDAPLTVNFTDQSTNSPTTWAWDFDNDGSVDSTEQNPSYTYSTAGTFTVKLTVTNDAGSDDETKTDYITVNQSPVVISLTPGSGPAGTFVTITGSGFAPSTAGIIWFDTNGDGIQNNGEPPAKISTVTTDASGNLPSDVLAVPGDVATGSYAIHADIPAGDAIEASAAFTVSAGILLSCNAGIPGVTTFVTGSGFDAGAAGTVWFDTNGNEVLDDGEPSVGVNTDTSGAIPLLTSLSVPSASTGSYNVRADIPGGGGIEANASFTITSSGIIVEPSYGNNRVSSTITVTGSGFAPSTSFRLFCDRNRNGVRDDAGYRDGTTSESGTFSINSLSWPSAPTGIYNFLCDLGKDGTADASAGIFIIPSVYISTPVGLPGANIGMNIDGFLGNATGYVWFDTNDNGVWDDGENQTVVTTKTSGAATSPGLTVPSVPPGLYQVCTEIPASGLKAQAAPYTVMGIALNPSSGTAGTSIDITGYGLYPNQTTGKYIWFDTNGNGAWDADESKIDITTDASGTLSPVSLIAPAVSAGSYNVRLSSSEFFAVFTIVTPPVAAFIGSPVTGDAPLTVSLTDESTNSPTSWAWDFDNDGTVDSTDQNPSYEYSSAGTYTVKLTVTNAAGSDEEVKTDYITVTGPAPKTWYVDDSGSADFITIKTAVDAASAGDTIIVKDGTYTENVIVDKSLVIQSENGAELTIVQAANTNADVFKVTAANVTIDGFTVSGATSMGKSGIYISGSTSGSCTVTNNLCSGNSQGISIASSGNTVSSNICTLSGRYGIYLSNATGNSVTGNTCFNNTAGSGFALYLADNADNNTVSGNTSDSNIIGIRVKNADSNSIFNNTSSNNNYGMEIATGSIGNVFYLNNFVGSTSGQLSAGYGAVAGNFWNSQTEQTYEFNGTQYTGQVGNYWSDYAGADADGNGVGDTPYQTILTDNDNYPLMGQWQNGVIAGSTAVPPILTADSTDNTVGQNVTLSFTDDAAWRTAVSGISVDGIALDGSKYSLAEGTIIIDQSVFATAKDYAIVVQATGYTDATVTQTINQQNISAVYTITPAPDAAYKAGATPEGINTMTVNSGITGLKYFGVQVTPVTEHSGMEAVVFTHQRNGAQLSINVTKADFDVVSTAQAGFNVQPDDVIKVYIVDDLTNDINFNPTILQ
ncbi:MAG: PKD domain-containing protein [Desulfotomaculaceae bacterium]|nr:PKD domain-containing protein [Desulfotomaculaceae bacterium]